jgi:hypothetical protein
MSWRWLTNVAQLLLFAAIVSFMAAGALMCWMQFSRETPRLSLLGSISLLVFGIAASAVAASIGISRF